MIFFAVPTPGHSNEEVQEAIRAEIDRVKSEPISDEELQKVKTRAKANLIQGLQSNMGIARQLGFYHGIFGDWRELFRRVDRIEELTAGDIQRVAKETLEETNRTVGLIYTETESDEEGNS